MLKYKIGDRVVVKVNEDYLDDLKPFDKAIGKLEYFKIIGFAKNGWNYTLLLDRKLRMSWNITQSHIDQNVSSKEYIGQIGYYVAENVIGGLAPKRKCPLC